MSLTTAVLLVLALYLLQIFLQETSRFRSDPKGIVGDRDSPPQMSVVAARLDRAKNNMLEAALGATVFLIARALYVPAYVSGIPMLRSVIWLAANAGLVMMALTLF